MEIDLSRYERPMKCCAVLIHSGMPHRVFIHL